MPSLITSLYNLITAVLDYLTVFHRRCNTFNSTSIPWNVLAATSSPRTRYSLHARCIFRSLTFPGGLNLGRARSTRPGCSKLLRTPIATACVLKY